MSAQTLFLKMADGTKAQEVANSAYEYMTRAVEYAENKPVAAQSVAAYADGKFYPEVPINFDYSGWDADIEESLDEHPQTTSEKYVDNVLLNAETFGKDVMKEFLRENIMMGITAAGKTAGVLGAFGEKLVLTGETRGVSFIETIEANSLTVSIAILDKMIAEISNYSGLEPFITADRLTAFRNKFAVYLGMPEI